MSITIVATPGSASANSFCLESEAIAYMATRLNASAWTTVEGDTCTDDEQKAIVEASRALSAMEWIGRRSTTTQVLSWPRWNAVNPDSPVGFLYLTTEIPQRVKDATCELAFQFLNAGTTDIASLDPALGVIEKRIDVITTRWDIHQRPQGLSRFPSVMRFLKPLLVARSNQTTLVRG